MRPLSSLVPLYPEMPEIIDLEDRVLTMEFEVGETLARAVIAEGTA